MTALRVRDMAPPLDPALPGLDIALSAHPLGTTAGDVCRVRSVDWVPRRRCRVVQEVRAPAARTATMVVHEVTRSGTTVRAAVDDPELPGLAVALSPAGVRDRLAEICGAPVRACRVTPVAYRPGSRAVVAYDVVAGAGRSRFYAKLLAEGWDRYAHAAAALGSTARRAGSPAPVPDVVAVWGDLGAVVQREAPGRDLSAVLRDESLPMRTRLDHAELLGRLLADVHATPVGDAPPWSGEDELTALDALLAPAWHADPPVGRSLAALLDRLADDVPAEGPRVLSHGSFRTGQVVVDGGRLSLLDLDTVSGSDAARDAGNALAFLTWADVRCVVREELAPALQEAFLAGYGSRATAPRTQALAWWTAAAMAKIVGRRYRGLAVAEWPSAPGLLTRAVTQLDSATAVARSTRAFSGPVTAAPVDLLDPDRMTDVLRAQPAPGHLGGARVVGARLLAEVAGRRRVVRYEVAGLEPGRVVTLIGKTHLDRHRSSLAHDNLRLLAAEVFGSTPHLAVPTRVCHVPALRMVLYREVAGTALDRLPPAAARTGARLAAAWLATLHGSDVGLARRLDLAHEIVDVGVWAAKVGDAAPDQRPAAYALADRLAAAAADLPGGHEVPIHKDFHAGHVLAVGAPDGTPDVAGEPAGLVVIDLDEARMGDPALDVAHLGTCLDLSPWPGAPAARAEFLAGYGPLPGPSPEARSAFFSAYTCMKLAKQLVTGRGPVPTTPGPARTAALTAVLRKGLACLAG